MHEDDIFCQIEAEQEKIAYLNELLDEIERDGGSPDSVESVQKKISAAKARIAQLKSFLKR